MGTGGIGVVDLVALVDGDGISIAVTVAALSIILL